MIDKAIKSHLKSCCDVTITENMPYGTSSEVFSLNVLEAILETVNIPDVFITLFLTLTLERFSTGNRVVYSINIIGLI